MFVYEKRLQYPVKIKNPNPALAKFIISQYGGPDGELGASLRYLSQRYAMPWPELQGLLTDIGTEELGHLEMVGAIVQQLTRNMTEEAVKRAGLESYFVDHTAGVYPQFASGTPWTAATIGVKGDVITDLSEDMAADAATFQEQHELDGSTKFVQLMLLFPSPSRSRKVPPRLFPAALHFMNVSAIIWAIYS